MNLTKYVYYSEEAGLWSFDYEQFRKDIHIAQRALDNVIDNTVYPLKAQEVEAKRKRRMGIGVTGVANAGERLGLKYGSKEMLGWLEYVMSVLRDEAYLSSIELAKEKGPFPLFNAEAYLDSGFAKTLPEYIRELIRTYGIRNSHLLSIAPTGTISLYAGNISSGIEPPFSLEYERDTVMGDSSIATWTVMDYAYDQWGIKGRTSGDISADDHINVLITASAYVDSACSKTCNVGDNVTFEEFKDLYIKAYKGGASGCTTFRPASIATRGSVLREKKVEEGAVCTIDPVTGERSCAD